MSQPADDKGLSYCAGELRRHDRDRFVVSLFAPAERRESLFALYAFNIEIAKVAEVVSEPMLGQIRLQWWRECLDEIAAGRNRQHPVALALEEAVAAHGLPLGRLQATIDARERDLEEDAPADLAAMEVYARNTNAPLQEAALAVLNAGDGGSEGEAERKAAGLIATAYALVGLLRAVPYHAAQNRLMLPADLLRRVEIDPHDLFQGRPVPTLAGVVSQVAERAEALLKEARAFSGETRRRALPALLPARQASAYLKQLRRAGYDPFDSRVQQPDPAAAWRILLGRALGRY